MPACSFLAERERGCTHARRKEVERMSEAKIYAPARRVCSREKSRQINDCPPWYTLLHLRLSFFARNRRRRQQKMLLPALPGAAKNAKSFRPAWNLRLIRKWKENERRPTPPAAWDQNATQSKWHFFLWKIWFKVVMAFETKDCCQNVNKFLHACIIL